MRGLAFVGLFVVQSLSLLFTACGVPERDAQLAEAPTGDNDPKWFGLRTTVFDQVEMEATLDFMPWPDHYWATYQGGISYRWQTMAKSSQAYKDFLYKIPATEEIAAMSDDELNRLSPAEKYDIWQGRTDLSSEESATAYQRSLVLSTARFNKSEFNKDEVPAWAGICNGWSLAAIAESEPQKAVTVDLADGRRMTFYVADIKALVGQIYNDYQESELFSVRRLGNRCHDKLKEVDGRVQDSDCRDMNPMTLHLALTQYLAKKKPFIVDIDPEEEVWNQPAYGYKMQIGTALPVEKPAKIHARGTKYVADVEVQFQFVVEPDEPARDAIVGTDSASQHIDTRPFHYTLELDAQKRVIGGEWKAKSTRPDFIWMSEDTPTQDFFDEDYPLQVSEVMKLHALSLE